MLVMLCVVVVLARCAASADPVLASVASPDTVGNTVDDNSAITWKDIPQGDPYKASADYDDGGMGPLFDFARSFINTCFPNGFPMELIKKFQSGNLDIMSEAQGIVMDFLGYAVAVVVGLLFVIIFPIIGCCFCCCRCCGNCGGKRVHKPDPSASCKRKVFAVILLSLVVMAGAGMACIFVSNDRMTTALTQFGDTAVDNLNDVNTFLNNTIAQVQHVAQNNFDFTKKVLFRDLDSLGYLVGIPVRTALGSTGNINAALTSALGLQSDLDTATADLYTVFNDVQYLTDNVTQLDADLNAVTIRITTACTVAGNPPTCTGLTTGLAVGFDNSLIPNITNQKTQLDNLQSTNLTKTILQAKSEFDSIPERVQNDTASTVQNLKTMVDDYSSAVEPMINMTKNLKSQALGSFDLDSLQSQIQDMTKDVAVYDKYRWYAGIGLTCVILLIVLLLFLGLACGVFGSSVSDPPDERGGLSNCGGNLLMASVGFIFIFSWLLMMLTTLMFMIGAPVERFVCQPLSDPDLTVITQLIEDFGIGGNVNGSLLGNMLFQDPSIDLTIAGVLQDCKAGKSAYSAFKLENFKDFNLTALTDYKGQLDINGQLDSINVDLSSVDILSPNMVSQLDDFKSAVTGIDFTQFDELNKNTVDADLTTMVGSLQAAATAAGLAGDTTLEGELNGAAADVVVIQSGSFAATDTAKNNLISSSNSLESSFSPMPASIDNVVNMLNITQNFIQNNGSDVVKSEANNFASRLISIVDSFIADALNGLQTEIGQCSPIYNLYASLLLNGFCRYMLDALNGFWFSLGWSIFFLVPSVIFAVKLVKHYRRMKTDPKQDFNFSSVPPSKTNLNPSVSSTDPGPMFKNKVGHADRW